MSGILIADDAIVGGGTQIGAFVDLGRHGPATPLVVGSGCFIRSHSVIYRGTSIGDLFVGGHGILIRESGTIGDSVSVGSHSVLEHHVTIEDGVRVHSACFIPEFTVLRAGAWIGPRVVFTNARYPNRPETKSSLESVVVGERAVIGANVTLLPGVVIEEDAIVGAGSVVVGNVPAGATVVGNPARRIR